MLKYIPVVCAFLYCVPCIADESKDDTGWFVTLGANVYSKNNIHYDIADVISDRTSMHDDNVGYNLSLGYDWEWIAVELALNRVHVDDVGGLAVTGRMTMPTFPLENMPYIGMEYGAIGARYSDVEYDISAHDETTTFGVLMGLRYNITDSFFVNAMWQYNMFKLDIDVYDVPIEFDVRRHNIAMAIGWRF